MTNKPKELPPKLTLESLVEYIRKDLYNDNSIDENSSLIKYYDGDGAIILLEALMKHFDVYLTNDFNFYRYFHHEDEINLVSAVKESLYIFYNWKKFKQVRKEDKERENGMKICTPKILYNYMKQNARNNK